jgi:hypothetical protein
MPLTERLKPFKSKANWSITMNDEDSFGPALLNQFKLVKKLLAPVVEATANILHPFIDDNILLSAVALLTTTQVESVSGRHMSG